MARSSFIHLNKWPVRPSPCTMAFGALSGPRVNTPAPHFTDEDTELGGDRDEEEEELRGNRDEGEELREEG